MLCLKLRINVTVDVTGPTLNSTTLTHNMYPLGDIPFDRVMCCKSKSTFLIISVNLCKYFTLMVFSLDPDNVFTGFRHLKDFLSSYLQSSTSVRMLQLNRILTGVKLQ